MKNENEKTSVVVLNDSLCQNLTKGGSKDKDILAYSIKKATLELIKRFVSEDISLNQKIEKFNYSYKGIDGTISDVEKYKEQESDYVVAFIAELIKQGYDKEKLLKYMKDFIIGRTRECDEHCYIYQKAKERR